MLTGEDKENEEKLKAEKAESRRADQELVTKCQSGELKAFDSLVLKHSKKIYVLIYNMTRSHDDTTDLMQDVFSKAFRSIRKFQGNAAFSTWLHTIAVNMTINFIKKRNRSPFSSYEIDDLTKGLYNDKEFLEASKIKNPQHEVHLKELKKKMNESLQKLSYKHRLVVIMFDVQGMSHKEISEAIGVKIGTVRSRLHYAHSQLQNHLREYL